MNGPELISTLRERGVRFDVHGERLFLDAPKGVLTADLRAVLLARKTEIVACLQDIRRPAPSDEELLEIADRVYREGIVLLYSTVVDDFVAFYYTEADRRKVPPGFVPYSDAELRELIGHGKPSPGHLRFVHAAKKLGARVTGHDAKEATIPPQPDAGIGQADASASEARE